MKRFARLHQGKCFRDMVSISDFYQQDAKDAFFICDGQMSFSFLGTSVRGSLAVYLLHIFRFITLEIF